MIILSILLYNILNDHDGKNAHVILIIEIIN